MKIKRVARWTMLVVGVFVTVSGVGIASWKISSNVVKVSAYDEDGDIEYDEMVRGYPEGAQDKSGEDVGANQIDESAILEGNGALESWYDARVRYPGVRTKNQHSEDCVGCILV